MFASTALFGNPKNFVYDLSGHTSYPSSSWAVHTQISPSPEYYLQTGIFFDQSNIFNVAENGRSGWNFDTSYINVETQGLIVPAGYSDNDPSTVEGQDQFYGAVEDQGFWSPRPFDQVNALVAYQRVSRLVNKSQQIALREFLPTYQTVGGASGLQGYTMALELNYSIFVTPGVAFVPDFQYIIHPNAQSNLPDAAFLGFKSHVEFF